MLLRILIIVISISTVLPIHGQQPVAESDYGQWGKLSIGAISHEGKWVSYLMRYPSGNDTLYVQNAKGGKATAFPKCHSGQFGGERWFAYKKAKDSLILYDLMSGKPTVYTSVSDYLFSENGSHFLFSSSGQDKKLTIVNLRDHTEQAVENILLWKSDKRHKNVAFIKAEGHGTKLYTLAFNSSSEPKMVINADNLNITAIAWQDNGMSLALAAASMADPDKSNRGNISSIL